MEEITIKEEEIETEESFWDIKEEIYIDEEDGFSQEIQVRREWENYQEVETEIGHEMSAMSSYPAENIAQSDSVLKKFKSENRACVDCLLGIHKINVIFADKNKLLAFLEQHGLIKLTKRCTSCNSLIKLNENNKFTCDKQSKVTTGKKKKVRRCRFKVSLLKGTFFEHSHIKVEEILQLSYWFILNRLTQSEVAEQVSISMNTVNDWFGYCREVVEQVFIEGAEVIGGPGKVVEIDEAKYLKRNCYRGRVVEGLWVFGGIEMETKRSFMVPVPDRSKETLIEQIKIFILPGTKIISNCGALFSTLSLEGYEQETVNHSRNFVDPQTGALTQNAERHWLEARALFPKYRRREASLKKYLALHYFIERYPSVKDRYHAFLLAAAKLCPPSE